MSQKTGKKSKLTQHTLIGMLLGFLVGMMVNWLMGTTLPIQIQSTLVWLNSNLLQSALDIGGGVFISSLKLMVVPLVFVSIVCGTAAIGDIAKLGRIGLRSLGFYLGTTALAISIGMLIAIFIKPGSGFELKAIDSLTLAEPPGITQSIIELFPSNPIQAMAEANMIQIIIFAGLFGVALTRTGHSGSKILETFTNYNIVIMDIVQMVVHLAPYGVFCLMAKIFATQGIGAVLPLFKYFVVVVAALVAHVVIVYFGMLKFLVRVSVLQFIRKFKNVPIFAFSTSSSGATLPVTLETAKDNLGVDEAIASFTIPLGSTINMDGTAIMQGVATCFIAQAYGLELSNYDLMTVVLTAVLASVGTAGVPGVGLVTLAMVLKQVGLPVEGIGLILGVDRLLDMLRTVVNVTGDAIVSMVIAKLEGKLNLEIFLEDAK